MHKIRIPPLKKNNTEKNNLAKNVRWKKNEGHEYVKLIFQEDYPKMSNYCLKHGTWPKRAGESAHASAMTFLWLGKGILGESTALGKSRAAYAAQLLISL